jgi:hypothetical protein
MTPLFHKTGREVDAAGSFRDSVSSTHARILYAHGLNLVVITLRVHVPWGGEPLGLPVNVRGVPHGRGHPRPPGPGDARRVRRVGGGLLKRSFILCGGGAYATPATAETQNTGSGPASTGAATRPRWTCSPDLRCGRQSGATNKSRRRRHTEYACRWAIEDTFPVVEEHLGGQQPQTWKGDLVLVHPPTHAGRPNKRTPTSPTPSSNREQTCGTNELAPSPASSN